MNNDKLLISLIIRLSHLADSSSPELHKLLDTLRKSVKRGLDESELSRVSEGLAKQIMRLENEGPADAPALGASAKQFADAIRCLNFDKSIRKKLDKMADQLVSAGTLEQQTSILNDVFILLRTAAPSAKTAKAPSSGIMGWLGKNDRTDRNEEIDVFLEKSARLLDEVLQHIDILNGNTQDTCQLREQLALPASVELLGEALEEVIRILKEHSLRIKSERDTTQQFLGDLRAQLGTIEDNIAVVMHDGDESVARASALESKVGEDVRGIGDAVQEEDIDELRRVVENRLSRLTSTVTEYVVEEKELQQQSQAKVEALTGKLHEMEQKASALRNEIKDKQDLAVKDPLTGVYNRAGYDERVAEEFSRHQRSGSPLSLVFVDCNRFKQINDTFGHAAGDTVLVKVASTLLGRARASDVIARYGGDEFVALLPDTDADGAQQFAGAVCTKIAAAGFNANGKPLDVSVSCGVTQISGAESPEEALKRADSAMYNAKKSSGLQVAVA